MTHHYIASTMPILNPERGFYFPYHLPGIVDFSDVRSKGYSLVHIYVHLDPWRETDIPAAVLDELDASFSAMRKAGVKMILRFTYNFGPYPDTEPDASKERILGHIQQLTPFLQKHGDITAWLEAGFIGAWGEWHTSTRGLDNITDKRDILFALLDALPKNRAVQVRYPANIIEMFPNVLATDQAFNGSNQSRIGHHNDCFLASANDEGTYQRGDSNTIKRDQAYLAELTRFTPMSGETCACNLPRSGCTTALEELALLHFSSLNKDYYPDVLQHWKAQGCFEQIFNRLGYRLTLTSANFNRQVGQGGILELQVSLTNTGFAAIANERWLHLVLDGKKRYIVKIEQIDPRRWEPEKFYLLNVQLRVPSDAMQGEYRLALWLPDIAPSLQSDPRYAIQFANKDVWDEASGLNVLGKVSITKTESGDALPNDELNVIKATIDVLPDRSN